ncbi:MAG: c-type cytochrome [Desulfobacterales bacterium]|nr:c-type cytochrome [Deltaproteobacteria bacterium]NNF47911.1 c-type cytochrome [Desulfofustis sp.]NNK14081.1 c-type cytochrome [Desulfofustis sp.]NNK95370.1 c-type cytochrome [Desulfobacterales bacterium]
MRLAKIWFKGSPVVFFILVFGGAVGSMAHEWMAPADEGKRPNPVASDMKSIERGKIIYLENCAACHGERIEGMKADETGLQMDSPNLKKRFLTHTDGDFFWKIQNGRGDMPSFKEDLTEEQTWDVINYIRCESE